MASAELAAEIRKARPEVKIVIGPTPLVEDLGREAAEDILPSEEEGEEEWKWLTMGISVDQVKRLFAAMDAALASGTALPPPEGVFPRFVDPEAPAKPARAAKKA